MRRVTVRFNAFDDDADTWLFDIIAAIIRRRESKTQSVKLEVEQVEI